MTERPKQAKKRGVANETEVATYFSGVIRGEPTDKDQLKAAELLGKHLGMFEKREQQINTGPIEIVGAELLED